MKNKPFFFTTGDAYFNILNELCKTRINQSDDRKSLLQKLSNKKIDNPYYNFGDEEFKMLEREGYIYYWMPNQQEVDKPESEKAIMATPKAFELVEARKSRITANINAKIAVGLGLFALLVSIVTLFKEELFLAILLSLVITSIIAIIINWRYLSKLNYG